MGTLNWNRLKRATPITIASTRTTIFGPEQIASDVLGVEFINNDLGGQTVDLQIEKSSNGLAPWSASPYAGLQAIASGSPKLEVIETKGVPWVRITAVASGAGVSAYQLSVTASTPRA